MKHLRSFKLLLSILSITSLLASPIFTYASANALATMDKQIDEVIVKYKDNENISVFNVSEETPIEEVIEAIEENPAVEYAEPNFVRKLVSLNINDPEADLLWGHEKISIGEAWQISTGTEDVLIGVIDTGVLYTHPDLNSSMWDGSNCLNENGSTTACVHGYDIVHNDPDPLPDEYHGTHIAGTIAATRNNNLGIAGLAPYAKVVALRIFNASSTATVDDEVRAIDFAIQNGVKVINASYGGPEFSQAEYDAIERFRNAGGIFVAAAGNGGDDGIGDNNELVHNYPSDYDLDNIISVAATTEDDSLAAFSNWGTASVDVGAPGTNIRSTSLSDSYAYANGTSMATPYVTGLAALIWSAEPALIYAQVRDRIILTGDSLSSLSNKTVTGKRVNAYNALSATATPPTAILSGLPSAIDTSSIPGLNVSVSGTSTTQYKYKLDDASWSVATPIATSITALSFLNATHTLSVIAGNSLGIWQSEASSTSYTWIVNDTTGPEINGLSNDSSETTEKSWQWSSADSSATFRFEISSSSTPSTLASASYSSATSTSASSPLGTIYLHVQAKDNNDNVSATTTVSVVIAAPPPPPPSSGSSGGGGGGGGGSSNSNTVSTPTLTKLGDINGDNKVDLLDFNNLMITWSTRANAFVDFNNLMINWTL